MQWIYALACKRQKGFTYADFLAWSECERWELIEGVPYDMSPAPSVDHQTILGNLHAQLWTALRGSPCRVLAALLGVRLPDCDDASDENVTTVVQPDLLVICQPEKLDRAGCEGAPDIVVEILSPSTTYKDSTAKMRLYQKHGVKEYWLVNSVLQSILVYQLEPDGRFGKPQEYRRGERLQSGAVPAIEIDLEQAFS